MLYLSDKGLETIVFEVDGEHSICELPWIVDQEGVSLWIPLDDLLKLGRLLIEKSYTSSMSYVLTKKAEPFDLGFCSGLEAMLILQKQGLVLKFVSK